MSNLKAFWRWLRMKYFKLRYPMRTVCFAPSICITDKDAKMAQWIIVNGIVDGESFEECEQRYRLHKKGKK